MTKIAIALCVARKLTQEAGTTLIGLMIGTATGLARVFAETFACLPPNPQPEQLREYRFCRDLGIGSGLIGYAVIVGLFLLDYFTPEGKTTLGEVIVLGFGVIGIVGCCCFQFIGALLAKLMWDFSAHCRLLAAECQSNKG
jgi:hypothetical protein